MTTATSQAANIVAPTATLGDLAAIMADLSREYPEAGHRVQHGAFLAIMGHAESDTGTGWWVQSERAGETQYFVLPQYGTCTCQDHQRHGHLSPCKHRLCVETLHRLERLEADRDQPFVEDPSLVDDERWYNGDDDAPLALELTEAAYTALDLLGEVPDVAPQCSRCHSEPALARHCDGLGAQCVEDELFGPAA